MGSRRWILAFLIVMLLLPAADRSMTSAATLEIGRPAPDFSLPGVDGKTYRLADFADAELLVIVFTCNHCPTAQAYEERIQRLAADYKDKGVALVAISPNDPAALRLDELGYTDVNDSLEDMKLRAKDRGFTFPYLYDGDRQEVSRAYGPLATPHVFIFDRKRKLRFAGRIDDSAKPEKVKSRDTRNAIEALLAGKPVPVEKTKTFGCSVKWSDKRESVQKALERWDAEEVTLGKIDEAGVKALLKNDSKKLRLVNVWATSCGPCVVEFPELVTMHRMYRKREFELVTISADEPDRKEQALSILKTEHASSTNYLWASGDEYRLVEAVDPQWAGPLPYTLLVAPGGKVLYRKQGELDPLAVRRAIVDYLGRVY
ncbi:MAG TPA: redoxin domain-containing protein [Thermoguttaceae bacterium]|nr:redoxin domain-containing protein [Thermoguttaceae bacterium]